MILKTELEDHLMFVSTGAEYDDNSSVGAEVNDHINDNVSDGEEVKFFLSRRRMKDVLSVV